MKLKSYLIYFVFAGIIAVGIWLAFTFGYRPSPIPKIPWSHYETANDFGKDIYRRLRLEVHGQNLLFLGLMPERESHYLVWNSFLAEIDANFKFTHIVVDSTLKYKNLIPYTDEINLAENQSSVLESIKNFIATKKRVVFIMPTVYSSYMVTNNFYYFLHRSLYESDQAQRFNVDWLTFSLSGFPRNRDQETNLDIPCNTDVKDQGGTGALGCAILNKSRTLYRKKSVDGKLPGVLDQIGTKEYLGLFN